MYKCKIHSLYFTKLNVTKAHSFSGKVRLEKFKKKFKL